MSIFEHVDTITSVKDHVKRKSLSDLIDFAINIVNNAINVDSLFTLKKINKKVYVKKFKIKQFKKKLNNFRIKAKSVESISKIVRDQEISRKKIARRWQKQITRHERQTQRRAQINDSFFSSISSTSFELRRFFTSASLSHFAFTFSISFNRSFKRDKRTKKSRYRRYELCRFARISFRFFDDESLCCYCNHDDDVELQWCLNEHHEIFVQNMIDKINCFAHESLRKNDVRIIDENDDLLWKVFQQRVINKFLNEFVVSKIDWNLNRQFHANLKEIKRTICDVCNEKRFNVKMKKKKRMIKCDRCIKNVKKNVVKTFFVKNLMNSNVVFFLSKLTIVKELLIARIHVLMNYSHVKSVQYKYFDHIINFM